MLDQNKTNIMRTDDLRTENRHRILRTIRSQGPLSRAKIGQQTGLSQASLSILFGLMTEQGIVCSDSKNETDQKRGRPRTTITLHANAAAAVTVALTIDLLSFSIVNYAGKTLRQTEIAVDSRSLSEKQLVQKIESGIKAILKQGKYAQLKAISLAYQGVTDVASGELLWSPILSIENVKIANHLNKIFNVPIHVNNDCGLIARALHNRNIAGLGDSFAAVLYTCGIGLGLYISGEPFIGPYSSALELGHIQYQKDGALCRCGKRGCIEAYSADYGIVRSAKKLAVDEIPDASIGNEVLTQLTEVAKNNGEQEKIAFQTAGKAIGFGLSTLFTLFDAMPVAMVGLNQDAVDLMRGDIANALETVGHSRTEYVNALHCFENAKELLHEGLVIDAMAVIDREFAEITEESAMEASLV